MSQRAIFIEDLQNECYAQPFEVYLSYTIPDKDDIEILAEENALYGDVEANYSWYEIGDGESGIDFFFSDDELLEMYKSGEFEKICEEKGYEVELIESGTITGYVEEN